MTNRRKFLKNSFVLGSTGLAYSGWLGGSISLFPALASAVNAKVNATLAISSSTARLNKTLVVIFQRGAADSLSMFSPIGDSYYNKTMRPNLIIEPAQMLKADSYFSFHPALAGMKSLWDQGLLSAVHQVGTPNETRSHFDAQDYFESGTPDRKTTDDGFLARAIGSLKQFKGPISSLSVQPSLARMISGNQKSLSFADLSKFSIQGLGSTQIKNAAGFEAFYDAAVEEVLSGQTENLSQVLNDFAKAQKYKLSDKWTSANLKGQLAQHLRDVAKIIKSEMNIPFIVTECGGWDTHNNQGADSGQLANKLNEFSNTVSAFVAELGPKIQDVTIVTVSEFGRTVKENGSRGTDHGHGSCYFVIGGGTKPKTIHADWRDLKTENLFEGRDLPVTTDYREVFSNILLKQFKIADVSTVFPNWKSSRKLNLFV